MNVDLQISKILLKKIKSGQLTEINLPVCDPFTEMFFEFEDENEPETSEILTKKLTQITFLAGNEKCTKQIKGIFLDEFVKTIPPGFKKNDRGITIEFIV
jgi:hypothetical protein